jgi:acetyl/propionyl-CoA carboxylase alpha subunit
VFGKVLVANRGEIAVRVIRALKEMDISSVAVYSDADRGALHATLADEAYHIGPTPAVESYLNIDKLIETARRSGAEAIHPGYGFLAESAAFARAVTEAGLGWIGPHPGAIEAMGSKVESRRIMAGAGVPITPGTEDTIASPEEIPAFAREYGYPVAVKAVAGGGGKGFAVARDKTQIEAAYSRARREGEAYFGDGSVYLERYLPSPRHIEIQVLRDRRGHAIEVRLNAEDAANDFVPSPGVVTAYEEPGGPGVRVDSSLKGPGVVPGAYDPLFAKLIVRGADRGDALRRLRRALAEFRVEGIATTLPFHRALLEDEVFISGEYTTGFAAERIGSMKIEASSPARAGEVPEREAREVEVEVNGRLFRVRVYGAERGEREQGAPVRRKGGVTRRAAMGGGAVIAPMQGTIVKVLVEEGQEVAADEAVCILEAMKMESEIRAQRGGRVAKVLVEAGETVRSGEPLVVLE